MCSRLLPNGGGIPDPWDKGPLHTYTNFLDYCFNGGKDPIYVIAGIPLPAPIFQQAGGSEETFWSMVVEETAGQLATHPAIMGFIFNNEIDGNGMTYSSDPNSNSVNFWWSRVREYSGRIKARAPGKLVGMALHDDPNICGMAQKNMENSPDLDFWGVNCYQTKTWQPVFGEVPYVGPGYSGLKGTARKAVFITEYGMPATSHRNAGDPTTIYCDDATIGEAASTVQPMLVDLLTNQKLCIGVEYFEFCDEWWGQPSTPAIYEWFGGAADAGLPNGFWDIEGFGLYGVKRGAGHADNDPAYSADNQTHTQGLNMPEDQRLNRPALTDALQSVYHTMM